MIKRPVFKAHYQVTCIPGEGVLLLSENDTRALYGPIYEAIVPLLDGRDADAIVDTLAKQVNPAKIYYALLLLEKNGYITEYSQEIAPATAAFWQGLGIEPIRQDETHRLSVNLVVLNPAFAEPFRLALAELGIATDNPETASLDVVLTDDYLSPKLSDHNRYALDRKSPWLLVKPSGLSIWLGPLFIPGTTACYQCLQPQLERNQIARRFAADKTGQKAMPPLSVASLPSTLALAARLTALEIAKFLQGYTSQRLTEHIMSLDLASLTTQSHTFTRDLACTSCGKPAPINPPTPPQLLNRPASFVRDGGSRTVSAEATFRKYQHLISPITGVVNILEPIRVDSPAHVVIAGHNFALPMDTLDFLKHNLRYASSGKGVSEIQAKTSALCEALERDAGLSTGREYHITASYHDLKDDAIHPNACMLYSDNQYRLRNAINAKGSKFNRVPEPFDDNYRLHWSPVWSLTEQRFKYLPSQFLYFKAKAADGDATFYCQSCSNGNASGNHLEEAVLQGFLELAERDAVALWWYNRLNRSGVDVASFNEPALLELIDWYDNQGREVWALDISSDLGLPTFVAISSDRRAGGNLLFGFGCHLEARLALQRAFTEMHQMIGMSRNLDNLAAFEVSDAETQNWLCSATLDNQHYLQANHNPLKRYEDYICHSSGDLLDDIRYCQRLVEAKGMEMLVLEQTRPQVGLPTVKVIVPGLRHFWARFAPGRLYQVPVSMGWLDAPIAEEALNPIPIFI